VNSHTDWQYASPAYSATAQMSLGVYRFEAMLFPVYNIEEVNNQRKLSEQRFAGAVAMPSVYVMPTTTEPYARYNDHGEKTNAATKAMLQELTKVRLVNVLIIAARYGGGHPRDSLLVSAYGTLTRECCAQCGRAPVTKRQAQD